MIQNILSFLSELRVGARSLARAKGLTVTVGDPGPRNRSQCRHVQSGTGRAAASSGQP